MGTFCGTADLAGLLARLIGMNHSVAVFEQSDTARAAHRNSQVAVDTLAVHS